MFQNGTKIFTSNNFFADLNSWATYNNLGLLCDPKETAGFSSNRWNVRTNPNLAFASFGQDSRLPDRRVLEKFPRS